MKREITPEISSLIEQIKLRVLDGRPLNISSVKSEFPQLLEQAFLIRPFLGWAEAVRLSGFSYSVHPHEHIDFLECPICGLEFKNLATHMRRAHEMDSEDYCGEKVSEKTVIARVGDLRESVTALSHWEAAWSREYVIDYFVRYYSKPDSQKRSYSFQTALIRYCGGTEELCREIGLYDANVKGDIFQSREAVIAGIQERNRRGLALNRRAIQRRGIRQFGLCENAVRIFGDWPTAVRAAGIDFESKMTPRKWTGESVREAFRNILAKEGEGLRYGQLKKIDPGLVEAVRIHLGPYLQAKASVLGERETEFNGAKRGNLG